MWKEGTLLKVKPGTQLWEEGIRVVKVTRSAPHDALNVECRVAARWHEAQPFYRAIYVCPHEVYT